MSHPPAGTLAGDVAARWAAVNLLFLATCGCVGAVGAVVTAVAVMVAVAFANLRRFVVVGFFAGRTVGNLFD